MSVQRYETSDGTKWRVRWREGGGRMRSRTVDGKRQALALDADVKARKYTGQALPRPASETLATAYAEWWKLRGCTLSWNTQRTYQAAWNAHVKDRFDGYRLNALVADPRLFEELIADMRDRHVGKAAQRKTLTVVSAVLTSAVEWNKIPANPLWGLRKPADYRRRHARPFPPLLIERIRLRMRRRETLDGPIRPMRDACFVSVIAYAGLRPGEALALRFSDVGHRTIAVDKALSGGTEGPTKTGAVRTVPLVGPLREDIELLRQFSTPHSEGIMFPTRNGTFWARGDFANWRARVWKPAVKELAAADGLGWLATVRPYDCRGSFVSLHLRAGASELEVARWAGHSPAVMFRYYANVIEELVGEPRISAEEQILRAREAVEARDADELDARVVDLIEHPTLGSGGDAAQLFYTPLDI